MGMREVFDRAKAENRAALIVYITAGDPTLAATVEIALALREAGADLVELGIPYSDPLADGPVIQAAGQRALAAGTTVAGVLQAAREIRERERVASPASPLSETERGSGLTPHPPLPARILPESAGERGSQGTGETPVPPAEEPGGTPGLPLLIMTCFNPILQFGPERFAQEAAAAGVSAVLVSDLPPEEAGEWREIAARHGLETVFLVTPVSDPERRALAMEASTGFVYVVSRAGTTGVRESLPEELPRLLERLRELTDRPLAVGFGISRPEHVAAVAQIADGAIVGSAVVRVIGERGAGDEMLKAVGDMVRELAEATRYSSATGNQHG